MLSQDQHRLQRLQSLSMIVFDEEKTVNKSSAKAFTLGVWKM